MAACASYMTGFNRLTALVTRYEAELLQCDYPLLEYSRLAIENFGNSFGDPHVGRISPSNIVVLDTFGGEEGKNAIKAFVDGIVGVLNWINDNVGDEEEFNHVNIEKRFKKCVQDWHDAGYRTFDFGEFRLMVCVQICCLAGIIVKGHKDLHNLVYPVASLGAAEQLAHIHAEDRHHVLSMIMRGNGLEEFGLNGAEGSLCETSEWRIGDMYDYVFCYLNQFCIGKDGGHFVKAYGSDEWVLFNEPVAR